MTPSSATVLIVDDDVPLRTAFSRAIERHGYRVCATTGSPGVLDLIAEHRPALVLMDNHMPETGGVELVARIRQRWSVNELPIVLISGSSIQGEIDEAMRAGANDFRRKPIDLIDLLSTVERFIPSPNSTRPVGQDS
ncbi:MAG: response regulator [Acidimicrobiia bacterium]|nr:response regulator [Acidimicrobiia bacterium]